MKMEVFSFTNSQYFLMVDSPKFKYIFTSHKIMWK